MAVMKKLLPLIAFVFILSSVSAQYNWEIGGKVGGAGYLGDIGGGAEDAQAWLLDLKLEDSRWSVGGFARYRFTSRLSVGGFLTYARISGDDNNSLNKSRRGRNLNFTNDMFELVARVDYSILNIYDVGNKGYYNPDFKLYLFAGVGGVYSNPKTQAQDGTWYNLRELTTENVSYSAVHFVIPTGLGAYFTFDRVHRIGMEIQYSWTFTDYLDDVSSIYADPDLLPSDISRELANRREEFVPSNPDDIVPHPNNYIAGNKRGNSANYDGYLLVNFYYSHVLRGKSNFYKKGHYNFLNRKNSKRRKSRAKF